MILQRLAEHYDRLEASGQVKLVKPGFSRQKVSFCIVLNPDGTLNSFADMQIGEGTKRRPKNMDLPGDTKSSGSGENPCFLWDRIPYLLGWSSDPDLKKRQRAPKLFESFKKKHLEYENHFNNERFSAFCRFLERWDTAHIDVYLSQLEGITRDCGVIKFADNQTYLHDSFVLPQNWNEAKPKGRQSVRATGQCLVSGQQSHIARLHKPEIKGVFGSPGRGVPFVSMQEPAYTSYGRDQSFNAPVSTLFVFKYAVALNHLLAQDRRRIILGDATSKEKALPPPTVTFWADHATPALEDCFADLFEGPAIILNEAPVEDMERVQQARRLLTQLRDGTRNAAIKPDGVPTKFFILGLSPNASRLSVRLWIEEDASELEDKLGKHLQDLHLQPDFEERSLSLRQIANATGRYDSNSEAKLSTSKANSAEKAYALNDGKFRTRFDTKGVSPQLIGELARSVLTGTAYPQSLLATMVRRIRSDAYVGFERVSAIKACLNRNARLRGAPMEVPVSLDFNNTDVPYRCGRLFALLERIQQISVKQNSSVPLNSTIKDRYFSAASSTPGTVFPRLCRLSQHHLAKIEPQKYRNFFEHEIGELMTGSFDFPRQLSLSEQGRFIVGYYQQREFRKPTETPEETAQ